MSDLLRRQALRWELPGIQILYPLVGCQYPSRQIKDLFLSGAFHLLKPEWVKERLKKNDFREFTMWSHWPYSCARIALVHHPATTSMFAAGFALICKKGQALRVRWVVIYCKIVYIRFRALTLLYNKSLTLLRHAIIMVRTRGQFNQPPSLCTHYKQN